MSHLKKILVAAGVLVCGAGLYISGIGGEMLEWALDEKTALPQASAPFVTPAVANPIPEKPTLPPSVKVEPGPASSSGPIAGSVRELTERRSEVEKLALDVKIAELKSKLYEIENPAPAPAIVQAPATPAQLAPPVSAVQSPVVEEKEPFNPFVVSVVGRGDNIYAIIELEKGRRKVRIGDKVLGGSVAQIDRDKVVVRKKSTDIALFFKE